MKVLMINTVCGILSTGRICTDILEILKQEGHECKIAYGRDPVPEKYREHSYLTVSSTGVKIDALKSRIFDNAGFNSASATRRLIKEIEEYNPDIIHLHNLHGYSVNVEVLFDYLRRAGKPIVWTLHDSWAFTGHCATPDFVDCERWVDGCHSCPMKKEYPASFLLDNSKRNYEKKKKLFTGIPNMTIITPSEWLAGLVRRSFLCDIPVKIIRNGIDTEAFKPRDGRFREKYCLEDKKILLGVAGAWSKAKGLDDIKRIPALLGDAYRVVLVGLSEKQCREMPNGIVPITRTNSKEALAEIYTAADVFINPTYSDNYPTVNLEAQACGTPVITYRTGGSVESVPCGNVVPQGDVDAMAALAVKVCSAADKSDFLTSETDFSAESSYKKYVDLYLTLV